MITMSHQRHTWAPPKPSVAHRRISRVSPRNCFVEFVYGPPPGVRVTCEGQLEYHAALCAAYRPGVVSIEEQLEPVRFRRAGHARMHWLDFRVTMRSGLRIGMAVKHTHSKEYPQFLQDLPAIASAVVPTLVDKLCRVTEQNICPVELYNAKLFHASCRPEPHMDAVLGQYVSGMHGPGTIAGMLAAAGLPGEVGAAARAIHAGLLDTCLNERITSSTMVRPGGAA